MTRVKIGTLDDLKDGEAKRIDLSDDSIAVIRIGDRVYALADTCSHAEASLSEGDVYGDDLEIECPLHGSTFELETGEPTALPATEAVATYSVIVEGDDVIIEL